VETSKPILILFDGVCNLCNGFVQFVIKRDPEGKFRFASLQSDFGRSQLIRHNINPDSLHSIIVIDRDFARQRSDAALHIARHLGGPWKLLAVFRFLPRFLRDAGYNLIASHRYGMFGRKDSCMIPTPDLKERFIE
jgi:predicted DCC family thiol-disulfide oxidoreductase YuxK